MVINKIYFFITFFAKIVKYFLNNVAVDAEDFTNKVKAVAECTSKCTGDVAAIAKCVQGCGLGNGYFGF